MLTFAVVFSRRGEPVPAEVVDRLRDRTCVDAPFDPRSHMLWSNDQGTAWFGGWQPNAEADSAHHWHVDDDGLTAFVGSAWPRLGGWSGSGPWAEQLARRVRRVPLAEGSDDLAGVFVAASLRRSGRCAVVADPLGVGLAYWGVGRTVVVVSSRASMAAGLLAEERGGSPARDPLGCGWLAYGMHAMGLQTGFEDVSVVPGGACVVFDERAGARLVASSKPPWRLDEGEALIPPEALAEARAEMTTAVRTARSLPGRTSAGLTGGKDSRLVLALLWAEGLADDVEFVTYGREDLPDVGVARQLAELLGLRHSVNPPRDEQRAWRTKLEEALRHTDPAASTRETEFRFTTWLASGSWNLAEPYLGCPPSTDRTLLSGGCGEALRTNHPATIRFRSKEQMAREFPVGLRLGSAGILRADALSHYRQELHRLFFECPHDTDSPQDVVDSFYIRNRLRRWLGTQLEVDHDNRAFPLYSITAVRLAFAIGARNRHAEWIHHRLMRETCERLIDVPFAAGGWDAEASGDLAPLRTFREPVPRQAPPSEVHPVPSTRPSGRTLFRDLRMELAALDRPVMDAFLRDASSTRFWEIFDPVAIGDSLDRFESLGERERLQLYGALSAAIWLGGHEMPLPRRPSASAEAVPIESARVGGAAGSAPVKGAGVSD